MGCRRGGGRAQEEVAGLDLAGIDPALAQDIHRVLGRRIERLFDARRGADGDHLQVVGRPDEDFFDGPQDRGAMGIELIAAGDQIARAEFFDVLSLPFFTAVQRKPPTLRVASLDLLLVVCESFWPFSPKKRGVFPHIFIAVRNEDSPSRW